MNKIKTESIKRILRCKFFRYILYPAVIYLIVYFLYQPHSLLSIRDKLLIDDYDGFQNLWNHWWVDKSLTELHQSPYYTNMIQWPHGVNLIPQTMNIFNSFGVILLKSIGFSLLLSVNVMILFGFIGSGVSMFLLGRYLKLRYDTSILLGLLFTFSSYHFAHGIAHMQLITMQFIPLFIIAWMRFMNIKNAKRMLLCVLLLFLIVLCDYYYFMYSVGIGGIIFMLRVLKNYKNELSLKNLKLYSIFALLVALTSGVFFIQIAILNSRDPLQGTHESNVFSLEIFSLVLPGGSSGYRDLTNFYWPKLNANMTESSVYMGYIVIIPLLIMFINFFKKEKSKITNKFPKYLMYWWVIFFVYLIMSLGPHPRLFNREVDWIFYPYGLLEKVIPAMRLGGVPVRLMSVAQLSAIILVGHFYNNLFRMYKKLKFVPYIVILIAIVELYPTKMPLTDTTVKKYVYALKELPSGAVIDDGATNPPRTLLNQTIHQKPIAFGYVTREPLSNFNKNKIIDDAYKNKEFKKLCIDFHFRYVVSPKYFDSLYDGVVYLDSDGTRIYDLSKQFGVKC